MDCESIKKLISQGEGMSLEFKRCGNQPQQDVFETICSFANRQGGSILLGVLDDGSVEGVPRASATSIERNIINITGNPKMFNAAPALELERIDLDERLVLRVWVPMGPNVYRFKGTVYDRVSDVDVRVHGDAQLHALYLRKQNYYTERRVIPWLTLADLRHDMIERIRALASLSHGEHPWSHLADDELLTSARLYARDLETGARGLTLAAALLLGTDDVIADVAPVYRTDALVQRENSDRYDDRITVHTNLIDSYDQLVHFCRLRMPDPFVLDGTQRVSARDIIIRELVSNTLMHREYSSPFLSRLVLDDKGIRTRNPSRSIYTGRITLDNLDPTPKNPIIANVFHQIGRAEELGSGTRNLYKYSRLYAGGDPNLKDGDVFEAFVPVPSLVTNPVSQGVAQDDTIDSAIIDVLSKGESVPISAIMPHTGVSERTVRRHLAALAEKGLVAMEGKGRWTTYRIV